MGTFCNEQNEQRQRRRDETAAGTTWQLKHFVYQDDDPLCLSFFFPPPVIIFICLTWRFADERLGRLFKVSPATEDVYVYQNNGPTFDDA